MINSIFSTLRQARIDAELQEIITEGNRTSETAGINRDFLLKVLQEEIECKEKFNDEILAEPAELIEELGLGTFYWMADVAVQITVLARYTLRHEPTNVEAGLGKDSTAAEHIRCAVRV